MSETVTLKPSGTRNQGIDLLRNLSMFMVVMLHVLGLGGLLEATQGQTIKYEALKIVHIAAMCAVNCYGLISGYVGYRSKWRLSSIANLWLQVFCYSAGFGVLFYVLLPGAVGLKDLAKLCLPVLMQRYWYFTAYFALFFTMPLLNAAIERIPKKLFEISFGVLLFLLTVCQQTVMVNNPFGTNSGYSYLWLVVLYCVGAYLGKYGIQFKKPVKALLLYLGCIAVCWLAQFGLRKFGIGSPNRLEGYNSPFVFLMGVALVLLFANMQVPKWLAKISGIFAPVSFGVYLIHLHPMIHDHVMLDAFVSLAKMPAWAMIPIAIGLTVAIFLICSAIDYVRLGLFRLLRIKQLLVKLENKLFPNNGGIQ